MTPCLSGTFSMLHYSGQDRDIVFLHIDHKRRKAERISGMAWWNRRFKI